MADFDITVGNAAAGRSAVNEGHLYKEEITFSAVDTPLAATDRAKIFNVPAGMVLEHISAKIITAEGAVATAEIGDGTNADAYLDSVDLNAAAGTLIKNGGGAGAADEIGIGTISAEDGAIYLDPGAALDTCVVHFVAVFLDMGGISASLI